MSKPVKKKKKLTVKQKLAPVLNLEKHGPTVPTDASNASYTIFWLFT